MIGTALATLGAGLLGAGATMFAGSQAAGAQREAAAQANALQSSMFERTQQNTMPFIAGGQQAFENLLIQTPGLTQPFAPTIQQLEGTPGYKFALDQTLKAGQNAFAAKGLGSSGAAVKGAQDRAFGLASTTFQQQLENYMKQQAQTYNMLLQPAQLGANAATQNANTSANVGTAMGNNLTGAGNATAGAWMAGANALSGGLNNAAGTFAQQDLLRQMAAMRFGSPGTMTPNALGF